MKMITGGVMLFLLLHVAGCQSRPSKTEVKASDAVVTAAAQEAQRRPEPALWKPGERKLYWLEGGPAVRAERAARPLWMTHATERLIVGNEATRDLSYQPALLPQEMEAELFRLRDLAERNRVAMEAMKVAMEKMTVAAQELLEQNRALTERLEASMEEETP